MRYVLELAYNGTAYAGWQRQPNAVSVEEVVDTALSTILGRQIKIIGCGRTDAGVHASYYVAHFDYDGDIPRSFLRRYNRFVADDIALLGLYRVPEELHARFHAAGRGYVYRMTTRKDPFRLRTVTSLPQMATADRGLMRAAAGVLLQYEEFAPFCKTHSDVFTMRCDLRRAEWVFDGVEWAFHIEADRFLRGMVRLIVGMCLRVGTGKITLGELAEAMDGQRALRSPWSAPATGLYLCAVTYPERDKWEVVS